MLSKTSILFQGSSLEDAKHLLVSGSRIITFEDQTLLERLLTSATLNGLHIHVGDAPYGVDLYVVTYLDRLQYSNVTVWTCDLPDSPRNGGSIYGSLNKVPIIETSRLHYWLQRDHQMIDSLALTGESRALFILRGDRYNQRHRPTGIYLNYLYAIKMGLPSKLYLNGL